MVWEATSFSSDGSVRVSLHLLFHVGLFLNFISGLDFKNFDSIEEKTLVWIYWLTITALLPTWGSR